ncbi:hypothetical protein LTS15_000103 [Exophiala xenobiotica]|nr:hypothetical protein LTS15_000103 [Exophiala xenobiotica]
MPSSSTASVKSGSTSGRRVDRHEYQFQFQRQMAQNGNEMNRAGAGAGGGKGDGLAMKRWFAESARDEFWNPVSRTSGMRATTKKAHKI